MVGRDRGDKVKQRKILMICSTYWNSPIQLGDHHLARKFAQAQWDVAYISNPISPFHLFAGVTSDLRDRFNTYRSGGIKDMDGHIWSYVPGTLFAPQNKLFLRSRWIYNYWQRLTLPNVVKVVSQNGFTEVDVLYFSEPRQAFWLDVIKHKMSVYRVADKYSSFLVYNREVQKLERSLAKSVDLVLYTAKNLKCYVDDMGPKRILNLPNGVNFFHFANGNKHTPDEYKKIQRPIVIYVGSIDYWFDYDVINYATKSLPEASFIIIGPDKLARKQLIPRSNLYLFGKRSYTEIPSYLYHADVGIIPFNIARYPELVNSINPLKLYEYMACGLPVVATEWEELKEINSPAILYRTKEEFVQKIKDVLFTKPDKAPYINFAEKQDWTKRFKLLEDNINMILSS